MKKRKLVAAFIAVSLAVGVLSCKMWEDDDHDDDKKNALIALWWVNQQNQSRKAKSSFSVSDAVTANSDGTYSLSSSFGEDTYLYTFIPSGVSARSVRVARTTGDSGTWTLDINSIRCEVGTYNGSFTVKGSFTLYNSSGNSYASLSFDGTRMSGTVPTANPFAGKTLIETTTYDSNWTSSDGTNSSSSTLTSSCKRVFTDSQVLVYHASNYSSSDSSGVSYSNSTEWIPVSEYSYTYEAGKKQIVEKLTGLYLPATLGDSKTVKYTNSNDYSAAQVNLLYGNSDSSHKADLLKMAKASYDVLDPFLITMTATYSATTSGNTTNVSFSETYNIDLEKMAASYTPYLSESYTTSSTRSYNTTNTYFTIYESPQHYAMLYADYLKVTNTSIEYSYYQMIGSLTGSAVSGNLYKITYSSTGETAYSLVGTASATYSVSGSGMTLTFTSLPAGIEGISANTPYTLMTSSAANSAVQAEFENLGTAVTTSSTTTFTILSD